MRLGKTMCLVAVTGAVVAVTGTIVAARSFFMQLRQFTNHLHLPIQQVELQAGINEFSFHAVRGTFMLRVGTPDMAPATFPFSVSGTIATPSGRELIDDVYEPTEAVLTKQTSGGYVIRVIQIEDENVLTQVQLDVTKPVDEKLICLFHGIK